MFAYILYILCIYIYIYILYIYILGNVLLLGFGLQIFLFHLILVTHFMGTSVYSSCHNKIPQTGCLKQQSFIFPHSSGGWSPKSRFQQGWCLVRSLSSDCRQGFLSVSLQSSLVFLPLRKRTTSPTQLGPYSYDLI